MKVVVSNNSDRHLAAAGVLAPEKVRKVVLEGVVDSGATNLVLPAKAAKALGLPVTAWASVRYADQRQAKRHLVDDAHVELLGREGTFHALVEPRRKTALLGAIVLEVLDLLVDCTTQKLRPRDPRGIVAEIE